MLPCTMCYWCKMEAPLSPNRKCCCNDKSPHYNEIFSAEEAKTRTCEEWESKEAYDYNRLNSWEFALKYYM